MPDKNADKPPRPGPAPDHVKFVEDDWEEAVRRAVKKPKPAEGWPKPDRDQGEQPPKPQDDG